MLTYKDRLAAMRKTKIQHTLDKKEQNGYTDLDDFGTVPLPKDYYVEPWYNSETVKSLWKHTKIQIFIPIS